MSKIFKALEKAERDKDQIFPSDIPSSPSFLKGNETESLQGGGAEKIPREKKSFFWQKKNQGNGQDFQNHSIVQKGTLAGEQFRKMRTNLLRLKETEGRKTFLVTSTTSGEGKSFIAANLAVSLASDIQASALLIECDLRAPSLSKWFGVENGVGLAEYLRGDTEEEVAGFIRKTNVAKLSLMPAGRYSDNPVELLGSDRMQRMIRNLSVQNPGQIIILDSTPILATTEPSVLSHLADGIIFVVRAGVTDREAFFQAIAHIEKEKIIGMVLNDLEFKTSAMRSRYFGMNGYFYHYGYGEKKRKLGNLFQTKN